MTLPDATQAKRQLYAMSKDMMGDNCGGLVSRLLKVCNNDVFRALCFVQDMKLKGIGMPRDYLSKILANNGSKPLKSAEISVLFVPDLPAEIQQRWGLASRKLADEDAPLYRSWIQPLMLTGADERFHLKAPSKAHADWVMRNYEQRLRHAIGAPVEVYS